MPKNDLSNQKLDSVSLSGSDLSDTDLSHSSLRASQLKGTNLQNANMSGSDLHGAHLEHADVAGADLSNVDLTEASLEGVNLERAGSTDGLRLAGASGVSDAYEPTPAPVDTPTDAGTAVRELTATNQAIAQCLTSLLAFGIAPDEAHRQDLLRQLDDLIAHRNAQEQRIVLAMHRTRRP